MHQDRCIHIPNVEWYYSSKCGVLLQTTHPQPGLLYFCLHDMAAVRSIINVLRIPELDTRVSSQVNNDASLIK
jgi:hypothetical protein